MMFKSGPFIDQFADIDQRVRERAIDRMRAREQKLVGKRNGALRCVNQTTAQAMADLGSSMLSSSGKKKRRMGLRLLERATDIDKSSAARLLQKTLAPGHVSILHMVEADAGPGHRDRAANVLNVLRADLKASGCLVPPMS